jgi:hypothetical protein
MSSQKIFSRSLRNGLSLALSFLLICGGASFAGAQEPAAQDEVVKV